MKFHKLLIIFFVFLFPEFSLANCWVNDVSKYHVSAVSYQATGVVTFHISEASSKLFVYQFSPSDPVAFANAKTMLSILLMAKLTGNEIAILLSGNDCTVDLTDGEWQDYIGIQIY
ncbi:MAG: hypothetical protein D3923_05090 [Candidatus Electrothrix sp. AR3]|nr:hypothetical protein [Candidatus Electrothrix sp. AR3]